MSMSKRKKKNVETHAGTKGLTSNTMWMLSFDDYFDDILHILVGFAALHRNAAEGNLQARCRA
jgi:hypothetical protein